MGIAPHRRAGYNVVTRDLAVNGVREFPEPGRQVAPAGADLLVTASASMDPFFIDHAVGSVARAHENRRG